MVVKRIEQFEFRVGGQVAWRVENTLPQSAATCNQPSASAESNLLVAEGVRRAVGEYGEVMRKLSNE